MRDLVVLFIHLIVTLGRLLGPDTDRCLILRILVPLLSPGTRQGYTSRSYSLFKFVNAARSADLLASLPPGAFGK
jgi:hypothetical protein